MTDTTRCPECKGTDVVPIVYGMPTPDLVEEHDRGEVELGGCVVTGNDDTWRCIKCLHSWAEAHDETPDKTAARHDGMLAFGEGRPRSWADQLPTDERKAWLEGFQSRADRFWGWIDEDWIITDGDNPKKK